MSGTGGLIPLTEQDVQARADKQMAARMKPLSPQEFAISKLERKGWRFANWISAHDLAAPDAQCAVMVKNPRRFSTEYCEVNPDGSVS